MFVKEPHIVKLENSDIIGFTLDDFIRESSKNTELFRNIIEYCRVDCVSLFFTMYVFLEDHYS